MAGQEPTSVHDVVKDRDHQRREWIFERIGWVLMALLVLAALAGALGPGLLSHAVAGSPHSSLWVEYDRFERHSARARLRVHVTGEHDTLRIWLAREFLDRIDLRHVDPEPLEVVTARDRQIFVFARAPDAGPVEVIYHFEPTRIGSVVVRVGLEDASETSLQFSQFVYP